MSSTVIKVENLSKEYRLGLVGHDTLYRDLHSWWAKIRPTLSATQRKGFKDNELKKHFLALNDEYFEVQCA